MEDRSQVVVIEYDSLLSFLDSSDLLTENEDLEVNVGVLRLYGHSFLLNLVRVQIDILIDDFGLSVVVVVESLENQRNVLLFLIVAEPGVVHEHFEI